MSEGGGNNHHDNNERRSNWSVDRIAELALISVLAAVGVGLVSITIAPASGPLSVFIGVELDRAFFSENASASFGSACISATTYGRAEDVGIARLLYRNSNSAT